MLSFGLNAVVLGGLINLWQVWLNFQGLKYLANPAKPLPGREVVGRTTLRLTSIRSVYLHALFAALSFGFPHVLVTTGFGTAVCAGISGYLLIQTLIFLSGLEHHQRNWSKVPWSTGTGAACYACSVYVGLNI